MFRLPIWMRWYLLVSLSLLLVLFIGRSLMLTHTPTPSVKVSSCGTLTLHTGDQNPYVFGQNTRSIEQCFVQAYPLCQQKVLHVTWMGVDAGTMSTFTLEKQGKSCQISQSSQAYGLVLTNSPAKLSTCQGLIQSTDSLILKQCGSEGDILIPRSEFCGYVFPQQTLATTRQDEACFMQDYHQCYGAGLGYEPAGSIGYIFQFDFACKLTVQVSDSQASFSCAGLVQNADGLHALNCGAEGTILIPARP